jgi:hypothetical protein
MIAGYYETFFSVEIDVLKSLSRFNKTGNLTTLILILFNFVFSFFFENKQREILMGYFSSGTNIML